MFFFQLKFISHNFYNFWIEILVAECRVWLGELFPRLFFPFVCGMCTFQ